MNPKGENDMKRIWTVLVLSVAVACLGFGVVIADEKKAETTAPAAKADAGHAGHGAKAGTISGELVDMGCYVGHGAAGAKHTECAAKCIAGGMPMGVVTKDGTLYLLTMSHANADPYNKIKEMAGKQVKVTGPSSERAGMKTVEVASFEAAGAATPTPAK